MCAAPQVGAETSPVFSPIKLNAQGRALPDRTGQGALDAVLSAAADIRVDLDDALSDSITVRELWEHYRDHLISLNRASATISRYNDVPMPAVSASDSVRVQGESYTVTCRIRA